MKIALCISGHLRNYIRLKENFQEFKSFLENYGNVDIFVTTWNNRNTANSWSVQHGLNEPNSHNDIITSDIITDHYHPTQYEILDYNFFDSDFSPLRYKNFTNKQFNWNPPAHVGNPLYGIHNNILISTSFI
jgi:hypothetical protein